MYRLTNGIFGVVGAAIRLEDMASIPFDAGNVDAQEFASWLWAGNKPEPAEEGGTVTDAWVEETLKKFGFENGVGG
jgi:hypothetical protein